MNCKNFLIRFLMFLGLLGSPAVGFAQPGCTDTLATNFDQTATQNDGSCQYPPLSATAVFRSTLRYVPESSGVILTDGRLWTFGDSGNPAKLYAVDTLTGNVLQTMIIRNYPNIDWEDIAADSSFIYIADLGNNNGNRTDLKILKIDKHDLGDSAYLNVNAQAIQVSYTDQTSFAINDKNNFDCEALISKGDSLYLFTKDHGDYETRVYRVSKIPGTYALSPYTSYNVDGKITGACYNARNHEVVLIGYEASKFDSFLWILNDFSGSNFFSGNKKRILLGNNATSWQTEGITCDGDSGFFISCEATPDISASLYTLDEKRIHADASTGTNYAEDYASVMCYPNPAVEQIHISCKGRIRHVEVYNMEGFIRYDVPVNAQSVTLQLNRFRFETGIHVVKIFTDEGCVTRKLLLISND